MQSNPVGEPAPTVAHLPQPRGSARWRWSTPCKALAAGGAMAAVFGLGAGVAAASTSSTTSGASTSCPHGQPSGGLAKPTVGGKITALDGDDITVQTHNDESVTVVYSSTTTFKVMTATSATSRSAPTASNTTSSSLKVGDYVGVTGTKNSNGTVTASSITISTDPIGGGRGGPPGGAGKGGRTGTPPSEGPPSA